MILELNYGEVLCLESLFGGSRILSRITKNSVCFALNPFLGGAESALASALPTDSFALNPFLGGPNTSASAVFAFSALP